MKRAVTKRPALAAMTFAAIAAGGALHAPGTRAQSGGSSPILPSTAFTDPGDDTGYVIVRRDGSGKDCPSTVYIDDTAITRLGPSQSITRFVPAGHHTIDAQSCGGKSAEIGVDVEANRRSEFQIHAGGGYSIKKT